MTSCQSLGEAISAAPYKTLDEYHFLRDSGWKANAALWAHRGRGDRFHESVYQRILGEVSALTSTRSDATARIADFGSGDGRLLRMLCPLFDEVQLSAYDTCPAMLDKIESRCRCDIHEVDLESEGAITTAGATIGVSLLSLIEMGDLGAVFRNMAAGLSAGGTLFVVVLCAVRELVRYESKMRVDATSSLFSVGNELVLSSHFRVDDTISPSPYYRFIRPLEAYLEPLLSAGFCLQTVSAMGAQICATSDEPRGLLIKAMR